jgi:glycosyltransferase involved in cell wall biosynthesis
MRLKVALVMEATHGGTARHLLELANGLVGADHSVHVLYSRPRAEPRFVEGFARMAGVRVSIVDMRREPHPSDATACAAIHRYLRQNGPFDVVHGHSSKGGALARLAAVGLPVARVYTPHCFRTFDPALSSAARITYGTAEWILSHLSEAIIAVSPEELEHAIRLRIPRRKLHLVVNGVDQPDRSGRAAMRARLGLRKDEICVGFLARYVPQKAPERMIEVAADLWPDLPPFRIAMVGDGPLERTLRARASAMGVAERIIFASGSIGPQAMSAFDVFALPSIYEAMPYVLLEAAAAGLPVVTTDVGGSTSVVAPGRNGFVVSNWDRRGFARHLSRLIQDRELRLRMGQESREIGKSFTIDRMIRETIGVYGMAMARRARGRATSASAGPGSSVETDGSRRRNWYKMRSP